MNVAERIQRGAAKRRVVVRCLGRFRLQDADGDQLQIRTRKARALLAALAFSGRPMSIGFGNSALRNRPRSWPQPSTPPSGAHWK